jgi:hypothetical protein
LLRLFRPLTVTVFRFVRPQLGVLNHSSAIVTSIELRFILFFLMLITRGDVVLRLQGSGLCDLKPDRCVASDQIDSYLEPDGRLEIMSPSHPPQLLGPVG